MKHILILCLTTLVASNFFAQELEVAVTINTPKLQTADPKVFETLETTIQEFMNNQKWTDETYEEEERIKLDIVMTITEEVNATTFKAEVALQSTRPVFGSTYETPMFKHQDKDITFSYEQFQPLEYSNTNYINQLSSIMAFYAYVVIGMDYDSFSQRGGEKYFQLAQDVVNRIPPTVASQVEGWRSVDGNRNRYWLVENLLTPRMATFRDVIYEYHRHGLDMMHQDAAVGRAVMTQTIEQLLDVNKNYPNSMIMQVFANTKSDEIIEIYKASPPAEKSSIVKVMEKVDPPRASEYRKNIGR